jgi:FtsP/CotA-like multicopper oxidase with cupredoxin domain
MREGCRISRRTFVAGAAALLPTLVRPIRAAGAERLRTVTLVAAPARLPLVGPPHPDTEVWAYGGSVPGPEIRVRQGDRLRIAVENRLPEETTVHWHGLRVPNAMDGVPHLTQAPIRPGETFVYAFDCLDAGTFWYHPHQGSSGQVGRGLYGALVRSARISAICMT